MVGSITEATFRSGKGDFDLLIQARFLGMNGSRRLKRLRFYLIEDFLDYLWVNNVGDNAHGATTQWTHRNINVKDSFERFAAATHARSVVDPSESLHL